VVIALSGEDLKDKIGALPCDWPQPNSPAHRVLAVEKVRFVGEPVAVVVASDRYRAQDAAELVEVDYDPLDAVIDQKKRSSPVRRFFMSSSAPTSPAEWNIRRRRSTK
jgi:carbon-monoxide dehydrogenase large subunit